MDFDKLLELVSANPDARIVIDSRSVEPGDCFVAITGTKADGLDYIPQAIKAGAKYIVTERITNCNDAKLVIVDNASIAAAALAQTNNGNPSKKLTNLAVTGTNGKTTVMFIVRHVLNNSENKCGLISTVQYDTGSGITDAPLTTPDCITIARAQKQMVEAGCSHMAVEASSHALSQNRLYGIDFKAAAFTNLTGDHLDYHKTESAYLDAKTILFENLSGDATAILNRQSEHSKLIAEKTKCKIIWYGINCDADLTAEIKSMTVSDTCFTLNHAGQTQTVTTNLIGEYNISNHLAAAGLCLAAGLSLEKTARGLSSFKCVPGRLERVETSADFTVLIDYAHTDDALKNVLSTLKPLCKGRLIVVFGCGGDRDRTKRPRMAAIAERLSDIVIVTSDNPRTEDPQQIIDEVITGFKNPTGDSILVEPDRAKAIETAIASAKENDIVLIAGKGHEDYQIIGKEKIHFSDKEVALNYFDKVI